ncbi:MAG TPA: DUF1801 domain-containing protein [Caulobacteraceae bacterium]|jgi:hypothetical protein
MFKVTATDIDSYIGFDPVRAPDLRRVDELIRASAPSLERWFVAGTAAGQPGMSMSMIGYGQFIYRVQASTEPVAWPVVGLALQKNYLSLYCSATRGAGSFTLEYAGRLGDGSLSQKGVLSFVRAADLDPEGFAEMLTALERLLAEKALVLRYGRVKGD